MALSPPNWDKVAGLYIVLIIFRKFKIQDSRFRMNTYYSGFFPRRISRFSQKQSSLINSKFKTSKSNLVVVDYMRLQ